MLWNWNSIVLLAVLRFSIKIKQNTPDYSHNYLQKIDFDEMKNSYQYAPLKKQVVWKFHENHHEFRDCYGNSWNFVIFRDLIFGVSQKILDFRRKLKNVPIAINHRIWKMYITWKFDHLILQKSSFPFRTRITCVFQKIHYFSSIY